MIVSPSTGILTTMIKVRQKPLPGTQGISPLYSHVERTSFRYERLIVLVSEGTAFGDMRAIVLSPSDANTFAKFQGFVTSLNTQSIIIYVPGGQRNLAICAALLACRYAADAVAQQHLLQWESKWELFLRRACMNVAAAQVILGMLKESNMVVNGEQFRGLPAFVKMSDLERAAKFGGVLGGTRMLRRASKIIDKCWEQDLAVAKVNATYTPGTSRF